MSDEHLARVEILRVLNGLLSENIYAQPGFLEIADALVAAGVRVEPAACCSCAVGSGTCDPVRGTARRSAHVRMEPPPPTSRSS